MKPNGGMDLIFTNDEGTGAGGTLNEVPVTAPRTENNGGFGSRKYNRVITLHMP